MPGKRNIDIAIFGATGFTGRLIAEYISQSYAESGLRLALAGRSLQKLEELRQTLGGNPHLFVTDAHDADGTTQLARRSRVVIAAAGPYVHLGGPMAAACAAEGTDYVDLCGEPHFVWESVTERAKMAEASGARLVHCCGFDSIPSDLGVHLLQMQSIDRFGVYYSTQPI